MKKKLTVGALLILAFFGMGLNQSQASEELPPLTASTSPSNHSPGDIPRGIGLIQTAPMGTGGPDAYGYQWDDSVTFDWKDTSGATPLTFNHPDEGFTDPPVDLGFTFPFYENSYTQVFVGTNGFLTFGQGSGNGGNKEIPSQLPPNNFIAPFWSDLELGGSGVVSTKSGTDGKGNFLAITYENVSKSLSTDLLTFQVLLYDNGDIHFQYQSLTGDLSASIGIEDPDGVIGLAYTSAPSNNLAIEFSRPTSSAHVKVLPLYQSGFTQSERGDFLLRIKNTGELGPDTYSLTTAFGGLSNPGNSAWQISLWKEDESVQISNTGVIAQGEEVTILVRLQAPTGSVQVGDYTTFRVIATSGQDNTKKTEAIFQAANPVGHFMANGNIAGLDLVRINKGEPSVYDATSSGTNPAILLAGQNYFYVWEANSDIEYAVFSYNGKFVKPPTKLTNNAGATFTTSESSPALTVTNSGHVGVVWLRTLFGPDGVNYNVFFAILDQNGNVILPPTQVTENGPVCDPPAPDCWQSGGEFNVPEYRQPTILATRDNRFFLSWIDYRQNFDGEETDLGYASYDANGTETIPADDLKNGNPGSDQNNEPRIIELPGKRLLMLYSVNQPASQEFSLHYGIYNMDPDHPTLDIGEPFPDQEDIEIVGVNGRNPDIVHLTDTKILVAWVNSSTNEIECGILSDSGNSVSFVGPIINFSDPESRQSNWVSVISAEDGYGILGWYDIEGGDRAYYGLVQWNGTQLVKVTPAIMSWEDVNLVGRSRTGKWIAPFPDWSIYIPLIKKN